MSAASTASTVATNRAHSTASGRLSSMAGVSRNYRGLRNATSAATSRAPSSASFETARHGNGLSSLGSSLGGTQTSLVSCSLLSSPTNTSSSGITTTTGVGSACPSIGTARTLAGASSSYTLATDMSEVSTVWQLSILLQ